MTLLEHGPVVMQLLLERSPTKGWYMLFRVHFQENICIRLEGAAGENIKMTCLQL